MNRNQIQSYLIEALESLELTGQLNDKGDIKIKYQGETYIIWTDEHDLQFFAISQFQLYPIGEESERSRFNKICNEVMTEHKFLSLTMDENYVSIELEMFVPSPIEIKPFLLRSFDALQSGSDAFHDKLCEVDNG